MSPNLFSMIPRIDGLISLIVMIGSISPFLVFSRGYTTLITDADIIRESGQKKEKR
jgi:hypothetical protein